MQSAHKERGSARRSGQVLDKTWDYFLKFPLSIIDLIAYFKQLLYINLQKIHLGNAICELFISENLRAWQAKTKHETK